MTYYLIPARRGSKGLPFKNRKLFDYTASIIPEDKRGATIVSTDDEDIIPVAENYGFNIHNRSLSVSLDTSSPKELLSEVAKDFQMDLGDEIITLYLTYPERSFDDVENIYRFYKDNKATTLLCKQEAKTHPYMCYYELPDNRGMRIINHDLSRRQDYPRCFFVSYFVTIMKVQYLRVVNENLYHAQSLFYYLDHGSVDVDPQKDLDSFLKK